MGNVRIQRTVLSPTDCGDIKLQYNMAWSAQGVRSTAFRDCSGGEEHNTLTDANFPIWGGSQVNRPRQFHSEILNISLSLRLPFCVSRNRISLYHNSSHPPRETDRHNNNNNHPLVQGVSYIISSDGRMCVSAATDAAVTLVCVRVLIMPKV